MATSSITANFTISDSKAAQAFATAFIRNSRKATTPYVLADMFPGSYGGINRVTITPGSD